MSQNESRQPETENGEEESPGAIGVGALLRNEKEKKGLSYAQISEITKLRALTLEALENEDWDRLPASVYVAGFIRSYARVLGLEEGEVVKLYQKAYPVQTTPPESLLRLGKTRKYVYVFLILLLLAVASAYYLWKERPIRGTALTSRETTPPASDKVTEPGTKQEVPSETEPRPSNDRIEVDLPSETDHVLINVGDSSDLLGGEHLSPLSFPDQILPLESEIRVEVESSEFYLRANIRERTWIRIYVDGQNSKEYLFLPGEQFEWKAKDGFDLLIGNAGGIDLEFNHEKIGNLGRSGQVVRLKLPQDYERR